MLIIINNKFKNRNQRYGKKL